MDFFFLFNTRQSAQARYDIIMPGNKELQELLSEDPETMG